HIVHLVGMIAATQLVEVAIETLELGKEVGIGIIAVDHADRVVLVQRRHQLVAGGLDGLHVTRSDVSSRAYQRKILHVTSSQTTRPESNQRKFHTLSQERRSRREPRPDGRSYGKSRRAFYDGGQPLTRRAPTPPAPAAHYLPPAVPCTIDVFSCMENCVPHNRRNPSLSLLLALSLTPLPALAAGWLDTGDLRAR